ncbi:unnamed protein product [Brachionus calyciflorus]|uniref:Uncharacterized protein n=1 Tax=Brachionus calyciflorus TaxID=104777 RepID=A0A813TSA1_9BILA|nr:unnamed protein product [Brachionus calyciflorus]
MFDSSPLSQYCFIQKDVYYSRVFASLIINDPRVIPNIQLNEKCIQNATTLNRIDLRNTIDFSLDLKQFNFDEIANLNFKIQKNFNLKLNFIGFRSIIVDRTELKKKSLQAKINVNYQKSSFLFYFEGKLVRNCDQIKQIETFSFLNNASYQWFQADYAFRNINICPLLFRNVYIQVFYLTRLVDTFYIRRTLKFENINLLPDDLNCKILTVYFGLVLNLKIDENFLNNNVFKYLIDFRVTGKIDFIQKDIFKNLTNIRTLVFDGQNFRQLIHKNGIDWIQSINSGIDLDFSNLSDVLRHKNLLVHLNVQFDYRDYVDYLIYEPIFNQSNTFPDEDFCIYKNFPFNQLVNIIFDRFSYDTVDLSLSCTAFWVTHKIFNYQIFFSTYGKLNVSYKDLLERSNFNKMLDKCNFNMRLDLCDYKNISLINISKSPADILYLFGLIEKIIDFILTPLACLLGILLNMLTILITLKATTNSNFILNNQFYYMKWNAMLNFTICLIQNFRLFYAISNLDNDLNFIKSYPVQILYIFFFQFLLSSLKFSSSCAYLYFSILRCSLIGREHGKIFVLMMNANPKRLILSTLILSGMLNLVKLFSYEINKFNFALDYPTHVTVPLLLGLKYTELILIDGFNFLTDLINYFGFLIVSLVFDLILINKLRKTIKTREKLVKGNFLNKSNDDLQFKSLALLILNSTFNFLLRLPEMYNLIYLNFSLINSIFKNGYIQSKNLFYLFNFASRSNIMFTLYKTTSFLYLLSISSNFFMFYTFNSIFRFSLKKYFKSTNKSIDGNEKSFTKNTG